MHDKDARGYNHALEYNIPSSRFDNRELDIVSSGGTVIQFGGLKGFWFARRTTKTGISVCTISWSCIDGPKCLLGNKNRCGL